jgi:hypothetical protein
MRYARPLMRRGSLNRQAACPGRRGFKENTREHFAVVSNDHLWACPTGIMTCELPQARPPRFTSPRPCRRWRQGRGEVKVVHVAAGSY